MNRKKMLMQMTVNSRPLPRSLRDCLQVHQKMIRMTRKVRTLPRLHKRSPLVNLNAMSSPTKWMRISTIHKKALAASAPVKKPIFPEAPRRKLSASVERHKLKRSKRQNRKSPPLDCKLSWSTLTVKRDCYPQQKPSCMQTANKSLFVY